MNRLSLTVFDRGSIKRTGAIIAGVLLALASYITFAVPSKVSAAACAAPATDYGSATATIKVDTAATYRIWSRVMAADASNNSYLLEVDGNTCYAVGDSNNLQAGVWTWVDYQNGSTSSSTKIQQSLTAGSHTIKMIGREAGVKLGRILLVSDLNCVPTDTGDNCATAGDTEAPAVDVTAPAANATVSGAVNVTATATDNVGVSKVEFYVNGALKSSATTSPYTYNWDTKTIANGPVSLMAKAYDAAGNSNSDTTQVNVSNGDTTPPTVPAGITATADAANKVTVKWSASTDNTAVTGYWVTRNGTPVAQVTTGLQYVDQTVLPATAYSYKVSAYDAAGNTSALSAGANVTTPTAPDTQAPSAPTALNATAASSTQINLTWTTSTDNVAVAAYDVYRSVGTGSASKIASVTTTSYGDTGLTPSTAYTYYVTARDSAGNMSQNSASTSATTSAKTSKGRGHIKGQVTFGGSSSAFATPKAYAATPGAPHAQVTLTILGARRVYDTDSRGRYIISDVPAGIYRIRYSAPGHYSKVVKVKVSSDQTKTQNVTLRKR